MQRPAGKFVAAHLRFAHGVEKELHVPGSSRKSREEIIRKHWRTKHFRTPDPSGFGHLFRRRVEDVFENRLRRFFWKAAADLRAEVLIAGTIAKIKDGAPDEIGGEASKQQDNEN